MNKLDTIGYYKERPISEMTREELLEFAIWATTRIGELELNQKEIDDFMDEAEEEQLNSLFSA